MSLNDSQISNKGFWLTQDETGHCFDTSLALELKKLLGTSKMLDLGCGPGHYTKYFLENGIESEGYDGNPNTPTISNGLCKVADLTQPHDFGKKDWVLSLEVGEHIPKEYESTFIQNLIDHSTKGIVLSWATPGQPGDGHVNCQSNQYVIDLMAKNGFDFDQSSSEKLRNLAELWWFKNTIMVFKKAETPKITFCIPSKSNLRYLKTCIPSIRTNASRNDHEIIVFVDSDEDGTIEWLKQVKDEYNLTYYVNPDLGKSLFGIGKAYDYCIEHSTTDIFMIFHADMMLGKNADLKAYMNLNPKTVVCSTRIEPPIHPNGGEKILLDFGMWPEEWKEKEFNEYVETQLNETKTTNGIFAPWMMYKSEYLSILGGHDPILHSCREDSDLFNRMSLAGFEFIQPWNSLVYHLTGRGAGSFDGDPERHEKWQEDMSKSTLAFIKKWGTNVQHTSLMEPIVSPVYKKSIKIINSNPQLEQALNPWFNEGQDIIVEVNGNNFTQEDFNIIQQLNDIIKDNGEIGIFELGNLKITINSMNEYQNDLIKI
jgi:GT2 family glycosyltransferase